MNIKIFWKKQSVVRYVLVWFYSKPNFLVSDSLTQHKNRAELNFLKIEPNQIWLIRLRQSLLTPSNNPVFKTMNLGLLRVTSQLSKKFARAAHKRSCRDHLSPLNKHIAQFFRDQTLWCPITLLKHHLFQLLFLHINYWCRISSSSSLGMPKRFSSWLS